MYSGEYAGQEEFHPLRIVVVDDHPAFRSGLVELLGRIIGIEVVGEANDGLEGFLLTQYLLPDAVFLDISMPRMNGLEAAHRIRTLCPRTKIVFITAHEELPYKTLAGFLDADGFLAKPSLPAGIEEVLQKLKREMN